MLDFTQLSPLMRDLHSETVKIYYLLLPVFFALAVAIQWFKRGSGSVDLLELLKRTIVSTLLLIAFPEITSAILSVTEGIANRIDSIQNLEKFLEIAEEKVNNYSASPMTLFIGFNDLLLAGLTFLSFMFLWVMRFLSLAMFHFFWLFYIAAAPLLLLFNIFAGTSQITVNLFRGLIEVACWKIVWAILGVMLASLSFGQMYYLEGAYVVVIVMNVVIAIGIIATPLLVHSLVGSGAHTLAPLIGGVAYTKIMSMPSNVRNIGRLINSPAPFVKPPENIYQMKAKLKRMEP